MNSYHDCIKKNSYLLSKYLPATTLKSCEISQWESSESLASVMLPDSYNNNLSHLLAKTSTYNRRNLECRGSPIQLLCSHCRPVAAAARADLLDQLWKFLSVLFTYTPTFINIEPRLKNTGWAHQLLSGTMAASLVHICTLTAGWPDHSLSTDGPPFVGLTPNGSAWRH